MIRAVRSIVHGNSNVDQAYDFYKKLVSEGPKKKNKSEKPNQTKSEKPNQTKSEKPNPPKK